MKRDFLRSLGITDDKIIDSIMDANGNDVNGARSTLQEELNSAKTQITDRDTQIEDFKTKLAGNADLQQQFTDLQGQIKTKDDEAQTNLTNVKMDYEIKLGLQSAGARNIKAASALLDRDKIKFGDDGQLTGLSDQIASIQKENDYLFQTNAEETSKTPQIVASGNPSVDKTGGKDDVSAFLSAWS